MDDERRTARHRIANGMDRFPLATDRPWVGYGAAIALMALAWWIRDWVHPYLPSGFPYVTFFPAIVASAFLFGLRPGILAAVIGFFLSRWFFVQPLHSFSLSGGAGVAMAFYVLVVGVDIVLIQWMQAAHRRLDAERRRSSALAENRELLFRELQHRVGNNLQMLSSMLSLQKRRLSDPAAIAAIDEASRRLGTVGRVQRQIYNPDGAQLDLPSFLEQVLLDAIASSARNDVTFELTDIAPISLNPDAAIPTALIVTEAVSNAIEHGFGDERGGHIRVGASEVGGKMTITVEDDGRGLAADFAPGNSLGLRIAQSLASGLGGHFALEPREPGTRATLVMVPSAA